MIAILTAAIIGRDGAIYTLPPPARHGDIGFFMIDLGHPTPFPSGPNQGFIASGMKRVFIDRVSAKVIARDAGQLLPCAGKCDELFSEDVW